MFTFNFEKAIRKRKMFKREFGTSVVVFYIILGFLESLVDNSSPKQGRKSRISNAVKLCCFLCYLKKYDTMESLGLKFGMCTAYVWKIIQKFKFIFINCDMLSLKGIGDSKVILIDGSETPVEKPRVDPVSYYGRKKCFSIKNQVIVDGYSKEVLSIHTCEGSVHDFKLFKDSDLCIRKDCGVIVDTGYLGIRKFHAKSVYPLKKPKNGSLSGADKLFSRSVSKIRVLNEHVIGKLKFFKILAGKFRHCKDLILSFWCFSCIVAGIYNLNLKYS